MWLPITEFLSTPVYFLNPDPDMTLTEPSMAPEVLSVFYLQTQKTTVFTQNPAEALGAPGRSVRTYPLPESISPPLTDAVREAAWLPLSLPELWLSFFPMVSPLKAITRLAESREIRSYFIRGAVRTQGLNYPNREWGYGQAEFRGDLQCPAPGMTI